MKKSERLRGAAFDHGSFMRPVRAEHVEGITVAMMVRTLGGAMS